MIFNNLFFKKDKKDNDIDKKLPRVFQSKLIFNKYSLKYLIEKSDIGQVYLGTNILNNKNYAVKLEKYNENAFLKNEVYILLSVKGPGIPSVISYGVSHGYYVLVQNLLGKSISRIWKEKNKKFNLKDTFMFAIQALERIEYIHYKNYIHRDIKPGNFLIGNPDNYLIYLIDFGNAKKYKSSRTGKYRQNNRRFLIYGTLIFLSSNTFKGNDLTTKDDLESFGLVIIYLYKGFLPWSKVKFKNLSDGIKKVSEIREKTSLEKLCEGMPREMYVYMKYVKNLKSCETPNYKYLKELFLNILSLNGEENDYIFSWVNKISNHRRLYSKNSKGRTNRMFFNLLSNASINLNRSDGSVNHEVSNVGNKCDSIISNTLKKNNNHSVGSNKIIIPYKKEKLNINSKKSNNNNEPNKHKKYKTSLIENETEKQQRLNKNVDLIKIKPLNNQNFNNKKKLPIEYIRTAKILKKNNNSSLNDKTNNNNNNIKLSKKTHPKIKYCLINNIYSDYPTKTNQNKNNINNNYNFITIDKEITSPKLIASFKPKLNVNGTYRAHHTQNFNTQIQYLNQTTGKILSSKNRPKIVFKPNQYRSIFLSKNIEYKGITDNLKNDQKINRIRNFKNFLHRKMDKKINRFNLREKLNENIYHRLFEQDSKEKLSINLIQNYIRKKF